VCAQLPVDQSGRRPTHFGGRPTASGGGRTCVRTCKRCQEPCRCELDLGGVPPVRLCARVARSEALLQLLDRASSAPPRFLLTDARIDRLAGRPDRLRRPPSLHGEAPTNPAFVWLFLALGLQTDPLQHPHLLLVWSGARLSCTGPARDMAHLRRDLASNDGT